MPARDFGNFGTTINALHVEEKERNRPSVAHAAREFRDSSMRMAKELAYVSESLS